MQDYLFSDGKLKFQYIKGSYLDSMGKLSLYGQVSAKVRNSGKIWHVSKYNYHRFEDGLLLKHRNTENNNNKTDITVLVKINTLINTDKVGKYFLMDRDISGTKQ